MQAFNTRLSSLCIVSLMLLAPGLASAACVLTTSAATVDLGSMTPAALQASDVAGYHKMGSRTLSLNGVCDQSQTALRLAFDGLQLSPGKALLRWGSDGALAFRIERASVGGVDVPMAAVGAGAPAYASSLVLTADTTVDFDLSRLPPDARKSFSVQVGLTGLLPDGFAPRGKTSLDSRFAVRMLGAN